MIALRWLLPLVALIAGPAWAQTPVAVFPFELADTSGEVPGPGREARLALATQALARTLEQSRRYRPVDLGPYAAAVAATAPRYACDGCWLAVARESGAALAVVPYVHKLSTLISTMHIWVADLSTGRYVAHLQGQIRGDTDAAYLRGVDFLIEDRLLRQAP